jgi:hypothetical protein
MENRGTKSIGTRPVLYHDFVSQWQCGGGKEDVILL